eukprot:1185097-Prorocentrum_minimum.AAC.2
MNSHGFLKETKRVECVESVHLAECWRGAYESVRTPHPLASLSWFVAPSAGLRLSLLWATRVDTYERYSVRDLRREIASLGRLQTKECTRRPLCQRRVRLALVLCDQTQTLFFSKPRRVVVQRKRYFSLGSDANSTDRLFCARRESTLITIAQVETKGATLVLESPLCVKNRARQMLEQRNDLRAKGPDIIFETRALVPSAIHSPLVRAV